MTAPRTCEVRIPCQSEGQAARVARVLAIEAESGPPRTRIAVSTTGPVVVLRLEADDTRGLRAASNSFLRWAQTALDVDRLARPRS